MKRTTRILLAAATAAGAGLAAASLPGCMTVTCQVVGVQFQDHDYTLPLQDSAFVSASTVTDCPDRISPDVTFSSSNPVVVAVTATSGTSARLTPVALGSAVVRAVSRDRPSLRDSAFVLVTGANP